MITWTSPLFTDRSMPWRTSRPATDACRSSPRSPTSAFHDAPRPEEHRDSAVGDKHLVDGDRMGRRQRAGLSGQQVERAAVAGTFDLALIDPDLPSDSE